MCNSFTVATAAAAAGLFSVVSLSSNNGFIVCTALSVKINNGWYSRSRTPVSNYMTVDGSVDAETTTTTTSTAATIVEDTIEVTTTTASIEQQQQAEQISRLKEELTKLSIKTNRGFDANSADRKRVNQLVSDLSDLNPTPEPAIPYYSTTDSGSDSSSRSNTLQGKWTLIYTDAPDITGLDTSRNPFATTKLGRIGQECNPPYIKNVIEWLRPDWAANLPFSGSDESRVLQKVVTSGSATKEQPMQVDLKVAGLELEAGTTSTSAADGTGSDSSLVSRAQTDGLPVALLANNPVDLKGPLNPPFGKFTVLYLDEEIRIIRTVQNFLAVNRRILKGEEWF